MQRFYACLEVSDTGAGISRESLDKIFDPFFSTKFTGRGLGLPVAAGFARASGGGVGVKSGEGRGTAAALFLPLNQYAPFPRHLPDNGFSS